MEPPESEGLKQGPDYRGETRSAYLLLDPIHRSLEQRSSVWLILGHDHNIKCKSILLVNRMRGDSHWGQMLTRRQQIPFQLPATLKLAFDEKRGKGEITNTNGDCFG